ncbi:MAG: DUF2807 domain-containing protein [Tannerella sp.]|jgi:hypothetical protein|nr:DUF2807 domain-containing protein [Tannerella sp.]
MKQKIINVLLVYSFATMLTNCLNVSVSANGSSEGKTIVGNGIIKEKEIGKLDFTGIDSRGSIDVIISSSSNVPVKVSGDENLIDYVNVSVVKGILTLRNKEGVSYSTKHGLKVTVPNNGKIKNILISGSSDLLAESTLTGEEFFVTCKGSSDFKGDINTQKCELNMSGSSDFIGNIEAKHVDINCSGSSDCKITGFAGDCKISMTGSSDFKGYGFTALKADCRASGSSDIQITCNEEISVNASGSSDVYYRGNAKVINKSLSGSSDLYNR